jgi:NAD(P)-dependent dehydrogenase (short-subunit alcohol dehydrogenase family)
MSDGLPDPIAEAQAEAEAALAAAEEDVAAKRGVYEAGRRDINVTALCPGFFPSNMSRGLLEVIGDDVVAHTPLGRLGGDEDLKGIAVFFASEASRHVTGQYIAVDGGASL